MWAATSTWPTRRGSLPVWTRARASRSGRSGWEAGCGSLLWADGKLYVSNLEGQTFVLAARPKFQRLASNDVGEPTYGALAASDGELFLRTWKHLYCLAKRK